MNFKDLAYHKLCLTILFCLLASMVSSQTTYIEQGSPSYDILDRMEIKSGNTRNNIFLEAKPLRRDEVAKYTKSMDSMVGLTKADRYWMSYLSADNLPYSDSNTNDAKHSILHSIYRSKANFIQINHPNFHLYLNPVLGYESGKEQGNVNSLYHQSAGFAVRGDIFNSLGFYIYYTDNQALFPNYIQNFIKTTGAVPGEAAWKPYQNNGERFLGSRGYLTYSVSEHIHLQFGNDRNFFGIGYRSLVLSDFAPGYEFFKINTQLWRFNYQNIFAKFTDDKPSSPNPYSPKYGAMHILSYDAAKWWNINFTETVLFFDNHNNGRGYDLNYVNPIIFYRTTEHYLGSPDNVLVSVNNNFLLNKHIRLYTQLLFDELKVHELVNGHNWWGNKYAIQLGMKYIDVFGMPNVDWQVEGNYVRPFTYTEDTSGKNFVTFRQPLADPIGTNFEELINIIRINTYAPLDIRLKHFYILQGHDEANMNLGGDIYLPYSTRAHEYGNTMLQGNLVKTQIMEVQISYMMRHNLFLDLTALYRIEKDEHTIINTTKYLGAGIRLNFIKQNYEF